MIEGGRKKRAGISRTLSLFRDENLPTEEPFPPGTRVKRLDPSTNMLLAGMVMDIPLSLDSSGSPSCQILFNNGTSASIPLSEMASSIPVAPLPSLVPTDSSHDGSSTLLPPFLLVNSRITYEHNGAYHKGFLTCKSCGMYWFSFKTHVKKKSEDWGVDLPNLPHNWVISALRAFWFQAMERTHLSAVLRILFRRGLVCLGLRLIPWQTLSALSISIGIARLPSFKPLPQLIQIVTSGFRATMKKRTAPRVSALLNILH